MRTIAPKTGVGNHNVVNCGLSATKSRFPTASGEGDWLITQNVYFLNCVFQVVMPGIFLELRINTEVFEDTSEGSRGK